MKQKLLFLLSLMLLCIIGTNLAKAADVTVGRSLEFSSTPTTYTLTGYKVGDADLVKVTQDDGTGMSIQKGKGLYYKTTSDTKINASCYQANLTTEYDDKIYAGMKLEIAEGYAITVTNIKSRIAAGNNFTYRIIVTDSTNNIYTSSDKVITKYNKTDATNLDATLQNLNPKLVLAGTVYVRIQYFCNAKTKYIAPLELSVTGEVSNTLNSYAIEATTSPAGAGTITGAGTYFAGQKVFLNAAQNAGFAFEKWQKNGEDFDGNTSEKINFIASEAASYTAIFSATTTYTITGSIAEGQSAFGSITNPGANSVNEGDNITFKATANEGYAFINWTKGGAEYSTDASINVTADADAEYVANFKKLFTVTYELGNFASSTTKALNNYDANNNINEKYANVSDKYTIPAYSHYYMYREGYIFNKWEDQDGNQYDKGSEITLTKDLVLTPVWTETTQTLVLSKSETTVTWVLKKGTILFNSWQGGNEIGYYTKPLKVNGELIAVPMIVDATSGKVDNSTRTDDWAQVNGGTKFTIPAIKGMTVVLTANSTISNTTVAGNTPTSGSGEKVATYVYTGENGTADIEIKDGSYFSQIKVTYPAAVVSITPAYAKTTYVTTTPLDFSDVEGLAAYVATEAGGGSVKLDKVGAVPAGTPLLLEGTAGTEYTVPVVASAEAPAVNLFKAGDGVKEFDATDETSFDYILWSDGKFYRIETGTTVATTKAYLHCDSDPTGKTGARALSIVYDDVELTGITNVSSDKANSGVYYNLNGQRIGKPAKGMYILDGKKYIAK